MIKKLGLTFLVLITLIAGVLYWLHGSLDGILRDAITKYGQEMTQAQFRVGKVHIDAVNGEGMIGGLSIKNPKGFQTPYAFRVEEFSIVIDPKSLTSDVVLVKKINIIAPDIIYEKGETMTNFDAISKNISGYLGPSDSSSSSKKFIVEDMRIRNIKAQASTLLMAGKTVKVTLADVRLRNLGKAKGGLTPGELGQVVAGALQKQLSGAVSFGQLGQVIGNTASGVAGSAKSIAGKAMSLF